jgi:methionyl-tRNA formyltransferase
VSLRADGPQRTASVPGGHDPDRVRTVFLGSGAFGGHALRRLVEQPSVKLVGVVTEPPRPVGRRQVLTPTPIGALADELGLAPVLTPARLRSPESIAEILDLAPGLAVLADYGQIVPPALLDLPHGALNLHPSGLPRWRGAAPIPATILAGDRETAVTLMRMDAGLDTGPLIASVEVPLGGDERAPDLEAHLAEIAAELLDSCLGPWLHGELPVVPQPTQGVTLTRPLRRDDGLLDPTRPALELERLVRAYLPWPGSFVLLPDGRLVVTEASVAPSVAGDVAGAIVIEGDRPALATRDGRLVLQAVVPSGRHPMTGADYLRGRRGVG